MSNKAYVVDTNIMLKNPYFFNTFRDALVIIPSIVLQELDNFKKDDELGKNAREFARILDKLYKAEYKVEEINVSFLIDFRDQDQSVISSLGGDIPDNRIIETAVFFDRFSEREVVLLSQDSYVRTKARGIGLTASEFTSETQVNQSDIIYPGLLSWETYGSYIDDLYSKGFLPISNELKDSIFPHMFLKITEINGLKTAVGKVNADKTRLELVNPNIKPIWGITPRNVEQRMALQLLLDPDIPLITISGKAGTGKTLLATAAGLVLREEELVNKILVSKPITPMGKDIGYLPGGLSEKLGPWLQSYYDNLEMLIGNKDFIDLEQLGMEINALTYLRGRSLPNQYFIIDEAQNLSKHEVKTIITRAGEGTKIILMGDPEQIDAPFLDSVNNGLTYVINKFKDQPLAGHITLSKGERSPLAEVAANIL